MATYPTPRLPPRPLDRAELVRRIRAHLDRHGYSRLELLFIVALAGVAGFLVSYALLAAEVRSMPVRYGVAGLAGYVAFLFLIWVWILWKSRLQADLDAMDVIDLVDLTPRAAGDRSAPSLFSGDRSGGGGASGSWGAPADGSASRDGSSWADAWDSDPGGILVVAAALLAGLMTIGYVVYLAPALFAEILVDAVIVATVSHRVADRERRDWTATVLRRTWLPAVTIIGLLVVGGWALQKIAPEASSIGPAIEQILE